MIHRLCPVLILLLLPVISVTAQTTTGARSLTLTIPEYIIIDTAALPAELITLGTGLDPSNNDNAGTAVSHDVTVLTNSATGKNLSLQIVGNAKPTGATTAWDDMSLAISSGTVTAGTSGAGTAALSGSSQGTFTGRTCTSDATCGTLALVSAIKGGQFIYPVQFTVTMGNQFALAGDRTFNATYTVSL